jgi:hypothetical protein
VCVSLSLALVEEGSKVKVKVNLKVECSKAERQVAMKEERFNYSQNVQSLDVVPRIGRRGRKLTA